jgi:hypothetical protein
MIAEIQSPAEMLLFVIKIQNTLAGREINGCLRRD